MEARETAFHRDGVIGPIPFLSASQCRLLVKHLQSSPPPPSPLDWHKGRAPTDRLIYDIATQPRTLRLVQDLIGPDVILWGIAVVEQEAGESHAWHTDIETSRDDCNSVSIWVGLHDTNADSTLQLITRSHQAGKPAQQAAVEHGFSRDQVTDEMALEWMKRSDSDARLACPATRNGEAVAFDGRIWHASFNRNSNAKRTAIILQYASATDAIRIPDFTQLEWPFRFKSRPRPPVISVAGQRHDRLNRLVSPPSYQKKGQEVALRTHVQPLVLPLAEDAVARWKPYPILRGRTRNLGSISAHVSVLSSNHSPHPPHEHADEELLILLEGEAELVIVDRGASGNETRTVPAQAGTFAYYPAYCMHTIRNTSERPVTYLMFRWLAPSFDCNETLACQIHDYGRLMRQDSVKPFDTTVVFDGPTSYLTTLHAHISMAQPGGGYDVHVDNHDVALVLQTGKVETLDQIIDGPGVVYYSAGEPHGLRNVGDSTARYLVFEFHSPGAADLSGPIPLSAPPDFRERLRAQFRSAGKPIKRIYNRGRKVLGRKSGAASYLIAARKKISSSRK